MGGDLDVRRRPMRPEALMYYRAQYYDPSIGRFILEDPIRFHGGGTDFYVYLGNNPTDFTDPQGVKVVTRPSLPIHPAHWPKLTVTIRSANCSPLPAPSQTCTDSQVASWISKQD